MDINELRALALPLSDLNKLFEAIKVTAEHHPNCWLVQGLNGEITMLHHKDCKVNRIAPSTFLCNDGHGEKNESLIKATRESILNSWTSHMSEVERMEIEARV